MSTADSRLFDANRDTWSEQLPAMIRALPTTPTYPSDRGNFFVVRDAAAPRAEQVGRCTRSVAE